MSKQGTRGRWNRDNSARYESPKKIDDARWVLKKGVWRLEEKQKTESDYCFSRRERVGFHRGARVRVFKQQTDKGI